MRPRNWLFSFAIVALAAILTGSSVVAEKASEAALTMYFFHETACASCDGTEAFLAVLSEQLHGVGEDHPYTLKMYNTFTLAGAEAYAQRIEALGLQADDLKLPAVIIGSKALSGMEAIEKNLRETFLTAAETAALPEPLRELVERIDQNDLFGGFAAAPEESTLLYFYRITCDECTQTAPVIDALPAFVMIDGQGSAVRVIRLNTRAGVNRERIMDLFSRYQVPEEAQMVPIVFLADSYLAGFESISAHLLASLESGHGLAFEFPAAGQP